MKEIFVTCPSGLERLLSQELEQLGIKKVRRGFCGVYLPQEMENVYRINYSSRLATRVLWPLITFVCKDAKALYECSREINWMVYIQPDMTFSIDAHVQHPLLRNSLHAAQVVKDALCDVLREKYGRRPSVDKTNPDVQFHLFIDKGRATLSFNTSGAPLYKRGYRQHVSCAPIQESLAAALLLETQYSPEFTFCDPFCGSATFLIEAAMMATHTPAGYFRNRWSFFHFPEFLESSWKKIKEEADNRICPLEEGKIFGCDRDPQSIAISKQHIEHTGFSKIGLVCQEIKRYIPSSPPQFVLCNPPYGNRLELSSNTYQELSKFIKEKSGTYDRAFFLSPFDQCFTIKTEGLSLQKRFSLFNGGSKVYLYALKPL